MVQSSSSWGIAFGSARSRLSQLTLHGVGVADFIEFNGGGIGPIVSEQGPGEFGPGTQCRGLPVNPFPEG